MPLQNAGIRVQSHHAVAVKIVAAPRVAIPVGPRISNAPVGQVQFRIIRTRNPHRSAARLPRIARPRVIAFLTRARNRVEPPDVFAGIYVIGINVSANPVFAARHAHNNFIPDHQRRMRYRVTVLRLIHFHIPDRLAAACVQRNQPCVNRAQKYLVTDNAHAPA